MLKLAAERLTGLTEPTYTNSYMEDGKELEAEAREAYETITDTVVEQVGFIEYNEDIGASPDGLIKLDGGTEIKCPKATTHIKYLLEDRLPPEYLWQVQGNLFVSGRGWWDFVSYCRGFPLFIKRVNRDESCINTLKHELDIFVEELKDLVETIKQKGF